MQVQDVDLRLLRIFVTIVECGGLSAAESRLNIGRSTISTHLSDLEIRLGLTLCKRGRSGFELTDAGRITYQASLELLQQCETFASTVAGSKHQLSGRVTIAIIDTLVSDPRCGVAQAIAALKAKSDNLQFDIYVCEAREVETSVANGRSLVGVGVSRHHIRGLDYVPLHNETNFLYCGKGHPLFDCDAKEISRLLPQAEVVTSNYLRDKESRNDGLNYQNSASYWVDKGMFRAILPERYHYQIPVMLITSKSNSASPLAQATIAAIQSCH
jgi:DNA-binding transcriptional LysR family regulator